MEGVTCGSGEGQGMGAAERARSPEPVAGSSSPFGTGDGVEVALASALSAAAAAGRFDVVAQLARDRGAAVGARGERRDARRRPARTGRHPLTIARASHRSGKGAYRSGCTAKCLSKRAVSAPSSGTSRA